MSPASWFWCKQGTIAVVLIAAALQGAHAQEIELAPEFSQPDPQLELAPEFSEPELECAVSDQQVVAATKRENVTLETANCTAGLRNVVDSRLRQINKMYGAFYQQAHLNPRQGDSVALLLVRRQLLTSGWSAGGIQGYQVSHYQVSKDAALLSEIDRELLQQLTPQQVRLLGSYEQTLPVRYLLDAVVTRLNRVGRPLSEAQWAELLPATQRFYDERRKIYAREASTGDADKRQGCADVYARANQIDQDIEKILAGSLDEEQMEAAQAYYRDLFERRASSLRFFEEQVASGNGAGCSYPAD